MRNFFKKVMLFLALPLTLILVSDIFLRNQNTLYKEKYEGAKKAKDSIEILILGTSQATYGINPEAFDLYAYNMANLGQSIYFDKRITLSLLPELSQLKYVFITLGYHSYAFSSQEYRDVWSYYANGIKYKNTNYLLAEISPTLFGYTPKVAFALIKTRLSDLWKHGKDIVDFDVQSGVDKYKPAVKGFIAFEGRDSANFNPKAFDFLSDHYTEVIDNSNEKDEIQADLEDFIKKLLAEGVTPVLITIPNYEEYNQYLNKTYLEESVKTSREIAQKYNIHFWNLYDSDEFSIEDFHDMDHLNREGSLKFSHMLNDSLKKLEKERDQSLGSNYSWY